MQAWFQGAIDGGLDVRLEIMEVEGYGDTAYEVGKATIMDADGQTLDDSKYIVIWKKVGDPWRMHRDIFNSNIIITNLSCASINRNGYIINRDIRIKICINIIQFFQQRQSR